MEIPGKTLLSSIVASRFRVLFMVFALLTAVPALRSQTANVLSQTVISANPPDTVHLAKAAANFTSTSYPSYFLGTSSNGYVYDTQTGQNCSVQVPGSYYERSRPIVEGSDKYAGVIVSLETSVVWLENPLNWGGALCGGWGVQVINPNLGAHDLHVLDLDGDGQPDVLASGIQFPNDILYGWMYFQNAHDDWVAGAFQPPSGDSLDVISINGVNRGARTNIAACNSDSKELYWYQNPGGTAARTSNWIAHLIASSSTGGYPACTQGTSLASLSVGGRDILIIASNETGGSSNSELWPPGLGYYDPGDNPNGLWTFHQIDSTYRDVHQIATDVLSGIPFFTVGEQEQASTICNGDGYNDHGTLYSGCRAAIFAWNGNGFNSPTILSNLGTQNQVLYQLNGVEYMAGANHHGFNSTDPAYNLWTFYFAAVQISSATHFVPVTPCRIADTRNPNGPFGGPAIAGGASRDFVIPNSACGIPPTAAAYSMNVAVVPGGPLAYVTLWPAGQPQPLVATLNSIDGRIKSNAAIVPAGSNGAVSVFTTDTTDVILDINGYFVPGNDPAALAFYPLTPCRVADTRNPAGPLGGPSLAALSARSFPILASSCGLPSNAQAYSLNFAIVPSGSLGFLTAWPAGQSRPLVASLNDLTGTVAANAMLVPAGSGGDVNVYTTNATDLVIDINGYFAPQGAGGLSLYPAAPCRVLDSRLPEGTPPFSTTRDVNVTGSPCGVPATAQAFVFNATVVPPGPLGFITMWQQGQTQPLAATLNATDGAITNNMAIVPTTTGSVSVFPSAPTHLVLDIFGYFAP